MGYRIGFEVVQAANGAVGRVGIIVPRPAATWPVKDADPGDAAVTVASYGALVVSDGQFRAGDSQRPRGTEGVQVPDELGRLLRRQPLLPCQQERVLNLLTRLVADLNDAFAGICQQTPHVGV